MWTIRPTLPLPPITDDGTVIDGTSQTRNRGNTNHYGPEIVLSGELIPEEFGVGLHFHRVAESSVNGLVLHYWRGAGIRMTEGARTASRAAISVPTPPA